MTLGVLNRILKGVPEEDFGDYELVRMPDSTTIDGIRIDDKLKVIYI